MTVIANSTYLDFTSYGTVSSTDEDVATAYGLTGVTESPWSITVALVVERASDPTSLLSEDWGTRQTTLAALEADGTLWTTYGANSANYTTVYQTLQDMKLSIVGSADGADGYVTSSDSRTIWVTLTPADFNTLFGTELMSGTTASGETVLYWNGDLSLPESIASSVVGIWPDEGQDAATTNLATTTTTLQSGSQSEGNASTSATSLYPQQIAELYNFPLNGAAVATGTLGLIEPSIGDAVDHISADGTFEDRVNAYLARAGVNATFNYYVSNSENESVDSGAGERALDVGVVSTIVPNSQVGLYVGSGYSVYTAYQTAIWDTQNNPSVLSSSWSDGNSFSPDSPFYVAYSELFVDAALRGISVFTDAFDGGSGNIVADGLTSLFTSNLSSYVTVVGGTSLSTVSSAEQDTTLDALVASAAAGDLETIWSLVRGGLHEWSTDLTQQSTYIETVWNQYFITEANTFTYSYLDHAATGGGVDTTQATPSYQTAYGLTPTDVDSGVTGRGGPDVSALAGGNMGYLVPSIDLLTDASSGGTSAATPLWAALITQINTIFEDQGLPDLGYSTDLYYIAAAIAPASFNDITIGNNISSYMSGDDYMAISGGTTVGLDATGYGYEASTGYDLTSGLGSPNGTLLARALTTIAHAQIYYDLDPVLVDTSADNASATDASGSSSWATGVTESLLIQTTLSSDYDWSLTLDSVTYSFSGTAAESYAWTASFAQQSLDADFSSDLVTMFDGYSQGHVEQVTVSAGTSVSVAVAGETTTSNQASLTADYGFLELVSDTGSSVEVARSVAVATTANGADDQNAVVGLRQNGVNDLSVTFYKVDDYSGHVDGLSPGDAGYEAAAAAHAYQTISGGTSISGGGYGAYTQTEIVGVDAGDLVAMKITSNGQTYWAFASANEVVSGDHISHLWSYGLNTWGWEDLYGGGDLDYNDLIVQLDFTSASGSQWLV